MTISTDRAVEQMLTVVPMLTSSGGGLTDLSRWLRGDALEVVLLVTGAVLFIRAARWLLTVIPQTRGSLEVVESLDPVAPTIPLDALEPTAQRQVAVSQALGWVVTAIVSVVVGALVADRFGIPLSTLVPTASVVGVAVGFGAQRVVLDIISGFFLLAERQLKIGDIVVVSAPGSKNGVEGTVEEITLRVTRLRAISGDVIFIPNGEIRQLTNKSIEWARLLIDVPLRPDDDVNLAIDVLRDTCNDMATDEQWADSFIEGPEVLGVQAIQVGVIQVRLVARVPSGLQWSVARELRRRVTAALLGAGIEPVRPMVTPGGAQ